MKKTLIFVTTMILAISIMFPMTASASPLDAPVANKEDSTSFFEDGYTFEVQVEFREKIIKMQQEKNRKEAEEAAKKAKEEAERKAKEEEEKKAAEEKARREALQNAIVEEAKSCIGNPYVWSGNSLTNGCDCSHFVYLILSDVGVYDGEYLTSSEWINVGTEVASYAEAEPGDVIVWDGHVALYVGNNQIINAVDEAHGIMIQDVNDPCERRAGFLGIRRFI